MRIKELMNLFIDCDDQKIEIFDLVSGEVIYFGTYCDMPMEIDGVDCMNLNVESLDTMYDKVDYITINVSIE